MKKKIMLPKDELPHKDQAIEWWYFNGFLFKGKQKPTHAFMTCLFKADKDKVNLKFLNKIPFKTIYFAHSLLYDLKTREVQKEVFPFVLVSEDSFSKPELFINYFFPIRKQFASYEIARYGKQLRIKTRFFDLWAQEQKKPLLEGGSGFLNLGNKTTYYYTYPNLKVSGFLQGKPVQGFAWHDKQWSAKGFMKDSWLWFSLQLSDNTQIVGFGYQGKKMATISYPNNRQETCEVSFIPRGKPWTSPKSKISYNLSWDIKIKNFHITTHPFAEDCEMNFGFLNYWEGPLEITCNGKKGYGFMEHLARQPSSLIEKLSQEHEWIVNSLKSYFSKSKYKALSINF
jgi:predicted secreted hydrolase